MGQGRKRVGAPGGLSPVAFLAKPRGCRAAVASFGRFLAQQPRTLPEKGYRVQSLGHKFQAIHAFILEEDFGPRTEEVSLCLGPASPCRKRGGSRFFGRPRSPAGAAGPGHSCA